MTAGTTTEFAAEGPEDSGEGEGTRLALQLAQGLMSAHSDTVSQLVEMSRHQGLHRLQGRLDQYEAEGINHLGLRELRVLIRQVHLELDGEDFAGEVD